MIFEERKRKKKGVDERFFFTRGAQEQWSTPFWKMERKGKEARGANEGRRGERNFIFRQVLHDVNRFHGGQQCRIRDEQHEKSVGFARRRLSSRALNFRRPINVDQPRYPALH